ncbi:MAG: Holliday junction resolvase RuvX [Bacteroidales bacterium]|nr:Holliday junction resolvase RuvX [Bacteroidales bacterium]
MARILAIDYGRKRTGLAVTDDLQIIASGLTTVPSAETIAFLSGYLSREKVECFVVGLPRQMNNSPSESVVMIESFIRALEKNFPHVPVVQTDERFTSKIAFQTMVSAGLKKKDRQNKGLVDQVSATIILQSYLEARNNIYQRSKP